MESTPQELRIRFELPEYSIEEVPQADGTIWHRVTAQGTHQLDYAGAPALPVFRTDLAFPDGTLIDIELIDVEYITITGILPEPGTGPKLVTETEFTEPTLDPAIYEGTAPYPAENLFLASHYQIRHTNGYGLAVAPFQYLPETQELRVMTAAILSIRADGQGLNPLELDPQPDFAALQKRTYLNGDFLRSAKAPIVGTLVLVYPSKWTNQIKTNLDNFVTWKRQIGWNVQTVGYPADTGEGSEALKEFLQAQYDATAFTHLVLLGDYTLIPPYQHQGKDKWGRNASEASGTTSILYTLCASDVPYAFLDGTDDLLYQDAFLSRLPVSTYAHINNLLNRLCIFEAGTTLANQSNPNWLTTGIFMGSNEASKDSSSPYYKVKDRTIVDNIRKNLKKDKVITASLSFYDGVTPKPTANAVLDALNTGASSFYYLGHGTCTEFVTSGFSSEDVEDLTTKLMLPYIIAPNCSSGNLEHFVVNEELNPGDVSHSYGEEIMLSPSLSEAFFDTQANTAVQAIIASTEVTFWTPPIVQLETFADLQAQWQSSDRLATSGAYATTSLNTAIEYCETFYDTYHSNYLNHYHALFEAWEMHLYGDASAVPRFGPLNPLNVSTRTIQETATVEITVTGFGDESPVANAAVCIEADDEYYSTRTDENGQATILLPSAEGSSITLRILDASAPLFESNIRFLPEDAVTANGATVSLFDNSTAVFTAILPNGANEKDYDFAWSSEPELEFSGEGRTVSLPLSAIYALIWQGTPVTVICDVTEKSPGNTATCRTLHLQQGWNLVALSLAPDNESIEKLQEFTAWTLEPAGDAFVQAEKFSPHGIYWLYASAPQTLVLTGEATETPAPEEGGDWQPFGAYPSTTLENCAVWKWQDGQFLPQPDSQIEPGQGYFVQQKEN